MRRARVFFSVVAITLLGMAGLAAQPGVVAQEASPAADEQMATEGLTFTLLGFADGLDLPSPAALQVARATFEPGAGFPFVPGDPTGALVIVESGSITARVEEQTWTISRGAALQQMFASPESGADMASAVEEVAMGAEGTLQAGDVAYVPGGVSGEVRNAGQETTTVLLVLVAPSGTMMGEASPTP
jgi:quercetin dioxygenase-like cupin family protein